MELIIEAGKLSDIDEIEQLYNEMNDALEAGINYPGFKKGVYPVRENAVEGVEEGYLYVARWEGRIAGSIILSHKPEEAYTSVTWNTDQEYDKIIVIHTLTVHPEFVKRGIGNSLMDFTERHARKLEMSAIRLDVYEKNYPAIRLYERCGYEYVGTVDLGYAEYGLPWYKLYEKVL
ncbi:MAG: acetyltransferase [Anaerocolumna sp.]|jgi:ribosomal protein S18 acetylase RimI-like enzyme|nr:acetyltransferase [Anaerocolumna sp.]